MSFSVLLAVPFCFPGVPKMVIFKRNVHICMCFVCVFTIYIFIYIPVDVVPVDVGIEIVVDGAWEAARIVPEEVPWAVAPVTAVPGTVGWVEPVDNVLCVVMGTVAPELVATLGLVACGVGCPAGTSVALLSGRAMDIRESRRNSFSVSKELRLMTG